MNAWPFDQSPNTAALTTRQVIDEKKTICVVVHYTDDHSWGFLCGTTDDEKDGRIITMREAVALDESLLTIADLPPGWKARRPGRGEPWKKTKEETL